MIRNIVPVQDDPQTKIVTMSTIDEALVSEDSVSYEEIPRNDQDVGVKGADHDSYI